MKQHITIHFSLACAATIALTSALAQPGRPGGGPPPGVGQSFLAQRQAGGPPAFAQALPEVYGILEAADADGNNLLDEKEQAILVEAMEDRTITKPEWVPDAPEGVIATKSGIAKKLAGLYAGLAPFDKDDNGALEGEELGSLRGAFMSGKLRIPFRGAYMAGRGPRRGKPINPPAGIGAINERPEGVSAFRSALPEIYANLSTVDENNDGQLNAEEKNVLAQAIESGTFTKPEGLPKPPEGVEVSTEDIVHRLASLYARISELDTNENGTLEEAEIQSMRNAIRRPDGSERRFGRGRPQGRGRPDNSTRSNRSGKRPFEGTRPTR